MVLSHDCPGDPFWACDSDGGPHDGAYVDLCHNVKQFVLESVSLLDTYMLPFVGFFSLSFIAGVLDKMQMSKYVPRGEAKCTFNPADPPFCFASKCWQNREKNGG